MPTAWFLPVSGTGEHIELEHLHGAFTRWLDRPAESADRAALPAHDARLKAFSLAPWSSRTLGPGIRINTVEPTADTYLVSQTLAGGTIRLGATHARYRPVVPLERVSWQELAPTSPRSTSWSDALPAPSGGPGPTASLRHPNRWELHLITPATFRTGRRATALPSVHGILTGLRTKWAQWAPAPIRLTPAEMDAVWVERYDLHSEDFIIRITHDGAPGGRLKHSGAVGVMLFRCDDPAIAGRVDSLLRFAPFVGIGGRTAWGLGATVLTRSGREDN